MPGTGDAVRRPLGAGTFVSVRPQDSPPSFASETDPDAGLIGFLNVLLRHRVLVVVVPATVAAALLIVGLLRDRTYSSDAAFVPQQARRMPSGISGFASQLGIALPTDDLDQSPAFYADLLRSREILGPVVDRVYEPELHGRGRALSLIDLLERDEEGDDARRHAAIEELSTELRVGTDPETGVVSFAVPLESPALAQAVANEIIERVNAFNLSRRQSAAGAERQFIEERLQVGVRDLTAAEQALRLFDERNLRIGNSPELRLERDRLARAVGEKQEVVTTLRQAHEQARIDEVRNTPAITVIESPNRPVEPDPRGALKLALAGFIITGFLCVMAAFAIEMWRHVQRGQTGAHREFRRLRGEVTSLWQRRQ